MILIKNANVFGVCDVLEPGTLEIRDVVAKGQIMMRNKRIEKKRVF